MTRTILVADDDPHILEVVCFAIEKAGMKVVQAQDGAEALQLFQETNPTLIVLDISMPEVDGLEVCKAIRKISDVPILFLSSRDEEVERIIGLEIGADDYVTKPFSPRELVARIKVILKRVEKQSVTLSTKKTTQDVFEKISHGLLELEPEKHKVTWKTEIVGLTSTEFAILEGMLRSPERVFDRTTIMNMAYKEQVYVSDRTVDSHIRHIRSKFEKLGCNSVIETVRGIGYKLGTCE